MIKKRIVSIAAVWFILAPALALAQTPAELAQTATFLAAFQNPDGGFAAKAGGASSLGSTSSAVRTLKFVCGSVPDVPRCTSYVRSCFDAKSGGFAPTPGATPNVSTTAIGLMAAVELKIINDEMTTGAIKYFSENVKSFEDIRIAVAGLEAIKKPSPDFEAWTKQVNSMRNADGTWGEGAAKAFMTGGAAAALLRMGVQLDKKDAVIAAMQAGQRTDGAWSKDDGPSTLDASYRIMRAFFMLKAQPDLDRLRSFIARCRQSDGGYSTAPGGTADIGGTYFAMIQTRWSRELTGEPTIVETAGFTPLFNGTDLTGWEGDTSLWSARDGMLVGKSPGIKHNEFLATTKPYGDFMLKLTFRLVNGEGNSGVQFRSVRVPGREMSGYQADIGQNYWGCLYDESRRNKVLVQAEPRALQALNKTGWNQYVLRVMGDQVRITLNNVQTVDYKEPDPDIAREGLIALQIHAGGPMEVQFKDIYIQPLPRPVADTQLTPGFHLRTLKAADGERKYTLFLPDGYDGKKAFPVVLFLHGAGERGEDGVTCAQVGLGAAIAQQPSAYPFIAIFPQARRTWSADSEDGKAAIATLDEVMKTCKVDSSRVILTGLSMGGAGTWSNAAKYPERFSAIAPVCGFSATDIVDKVKGLPTWAFLGDADSDRIVSSTRSILEALRQAGGKPKSTEYRGVGHNSWDRAYTTASLVDWMLSQKRSGAN